MHAIPQYVCLKQGMWYLCIIFFQKMHFSDAIPISFVSLLRILVCWPLTPNPLLACSTNSVRATVQANCYLLKNCSGACTCLLEWFIQDHSGPFRRMNDSFRGMFQNVHLFQNECSDRKSHTVGWKYPAVTCSYKVVRIVWMVRLATNM